MIWKKRGVTDRNSPVKMDRETCSGGD